MATIREYIEAKLNGFEIAISEVELDTLLVDYDVDGSEEYTRLNSLGAKKAVFSILLQIFAMPDVTQAQYSRKWDRPSLLKIINQWASDIGEPLPFPVDEPTISDASFFW